MGGIGSGGARKNAGRKLLDCAPRVKVSVSMPSWPLDLVRREAKQQQLSISQTITELITKGLER